MRIIEFTAKHYKQAALFLADQSKKQDNENILSKNFGWWLERFNYFWDLNPAYKSDWKKGWLIEVDGDLRGYIADVPTYFMANGKKIIVHNSTSWFVDIDYRNYSLSLYFTLLKSVGKGLLFSTTANQLITPMRKKLKFEYLPMSKEIAKTKNVWVIIKNPRKPLEQKLPFSAFNGLLSYPLKFVLKYQLRAPKFETNFQLKFNKKIPIEDLDNLWERTNNYYGNTNFRDGEFLNWLCFSSGIFKKILVGIYDTNDVLRGYLIFKPNHHKYGTNLRLIDVWWEKNYEDAITHGIWQFCNTKLAEQFDLILFPQMSFPFTKILKKLNPRYHKMINRNDFIYLSDPLINLTPENSYFVPGQGDYGI